MQLLNKNSQLISLLNNTKFGVLLIDEEKKILLYNDQIAKIAGCKNTGDFDTSQAAKIYSEIIKNIPKKLKNFSNENRNVVIKDLHENNVELWITYESVDYNKNKCFLIIVEDISIIKSIFAERNQGITLRKIMTNLLDSKYEVIDKEIESSLKLIGEFYNVDCVSFIVYEIRKDYVGYEYFWYKNSEVAAKLSKKHDIFDREYLNTNLKKYNPILFCSRSPKKIPEKIKELFDKKNISSYFGSFLVKNKKLVSQISFMNLQQDFIQCPSGVEEVFSAFHDTLYNLLNKRETYFFYTVFEQAVNYANDAIVYFDEENRIRTYNEAFKKMFSTNDENIIKKHMSEVFNEIFIGFIKDFFMEDYKSGKNVYFEQWYEFSNSEKKFIGFNLYPFINTSNAVSGLVMVLEDKTERMMNETEILTIRENERQSIGLELHDDLSHDLLEIAIVAKMYSKIIQNGDGLSFDNLRTIETMANRALEKTRMLSKKFCNFNEFEQDLIIIFERIKKLNQNFDFDINISCDESIVVKDPFKSENLFYIISECVSNIIKHSEVIKIDINVEYKGEIIYISMESVSKKILNNNSSPGIGFKIMKCRARLIEASFDYKFTEEGDTKIIINFHNI